MISPSLALGAPHTTFLSSPSPISTSQTLSLSAFGCFFVLITLAILNNSVPDDKFSTVSTSESNFRSFQSQNFTSLQLYDFVDRKTFRFRLLYTLFWFVRNVSKKRIWHFRLYQIFRLFNSPK